MKDYSFYLFTKLYDVIIGTQIEYDILFELLVDLHKEYEMSHFNDGRLSEYDCIVNFLNHKKHSL